MGHELLNRTPEVMLNFTRDRNDYFFKESFTEITVYNCCMLFCVKLLHSPDKNFS